MILNYTRIHLMYIIYTFGISKNFLSAVFLSACRALRFLSRLSLPFWGEDSSDNKEGFLEMSCIKEMRWVWFTLRMWLPAELLFPLYR